MNSSNPAFDIFIDQKFVPLGTKARIAIVVLIILLPAALFYFLYFEDKSNNIKSLNGQIITVKNDIAAAKKAVAEGPKFQKKLEEMRLKFAEIAVLLPKEKEIPQLLKDISSLGRNAGLDFYTFKPQATVAKDFYSEIPVSIKVRGPYHNMGFFFDQVSKLDRIVSVTNVKMSSPKREEGEMLLNSDCRLLTYMFTNKALPKPKKK